MDTQEKVGNAGERMVLGTSSKRVEEDHLARYEFAKKYVVNKRVLDIACGTGYGARMLSEAGAIEVIGVDIDQGAIDYATQKYEKTGLSFVCDSVSTVSLPQNNFDVVVTFETIEHLNDEIRSQYLQLIKTVLKEDGVIILSTPNKLITSPWSEKPLNLHHVLEYYRDDLEVELKKYGLTIKEWFGQRFVKKFFTNRLSYICIRIFEKMIRKSLHIYDIADSAEVRPVIIGREPRYFVVICKKS
jgi:2-polyprenyl-3-methyl-5-hydroxy-6-metoxy-1,4-benzoquinol methylase